MQVSMPFFLSSLVIPHIRPVNYIVVDDQQSSGLIKGIQLGVLGPGASGKKTIHLFNSGAGGERMIDVSIQSRPNDSEDETSDDDDDENDLLSEDKMETLRTLVIPTVNPFKVTSDVSYRHKQEPLLGLADLQTFDAKFWDDRRGGEAIASIKIECTGPWNLLLDGVTLERQVRCCSRLLSQFGGLTTARTIFKQRSLNVQQIRTMLTCSLLVGRSYVWKIASQSSF